jgi:hypothetical protein
MTIATKINDVIALSEETASEPREVNASELSDVFGGAETKDWTTPGPYIEIRNDAIQARTEAGREIRQGLLNFQWGDAYKASEKWAEAVQNQQWAEKELNNLSQKQAEAPPPPPPPPPPANASYEPNMSLNNGGVGYGNGGDIVQVTNEAGSGNSY